jgi:uncharacterized Zn finger protein
MLLNNTKGQKPYIECTECGHITHL